MSESGGYEFNFLRFSEHVLSRDSVPPLLQRPPPKPFLMRAVGVHST